MNPSPRRVFFKGFLCCLRQPGGFATLRQKAGKSNMPVCICFLRCVPAVFMLCIKYHQGTTCDMHRSPDRVRPSLRLILSGSGNTAWEQVSDQGYRNPVCNIYVLFSLSGGLSFIREPVRNRCGQRLCRGCCLPCRPSFRYAAAKAGKDRHICFEFHALCTDNMG